MNTRGPWRTDALATTWEHYRPAMLERVDLIERAVTASIAGELDEELRAEARRAAHTLAGSVGTFGFARASRAAGELELALTDAAPAQALTLSALVVTMRNELESEMLVSLQVPPAESTDEHPRVLLVDDDRELCARTRPLIPVTISVVSHPGSLVDTAPPESPARSQREPR